MVHFWFCLKDSSRTLKVEVKVFHNAIHPSPETSASQIFHGDNSTFINSFDKIKCLLHSPTDAGPQFLQKLENLSLMQML